MHTSFALDGLYPLFFRSTVGVHLILCHPLLGCHAFRPVGWGGGQGGQKTPPPKLDQKGPKRSIFSPLNWAKVQVHNSRNRPHPPTPAFKNPGYGPVFLGLFFLGLSATVLSSLVMAFVSSPVFFSYGIFFWGVSQDFGCTTVTTCPCKIGTTNPRPPYLTKHGRSNIPA